MGYYVFSERRWVWVWVYVVCCGFGSTAVEKRVILIDEMLAISSTDEDFICATLDWWPPQKCDFGKCSWGSASLLNLDLNNKIFLNAVKAFSPLKIRLGGTLQDKVYYQTIPQSKCGHFKKKDSEMFSFTEGCLPLDRWDELNKFFAKSGALVIFGLNALRGKIINNNEATGPWRYLNAKSLIQYTVDKGYYIYGWELGNELCGKNYIGVGINVLDYASDTIALHKLIQDLYKNVGKKPVVIGPGGFLDKDWYTQFIDNTVGSLNVITHHIYNVGGGGDSTVLYKILNPPDDGSSAFRELRDAIRFSRNPAVVSWVGEGGGVWGSGQDKVTNRFVFGFWYLTQLGEASIYGTRTYCRQSLIGGNYGLLDTDTFVPNPDYYSALLWHRLMGQRVLWAKYNGPELVRTYAHCAKKSINGITLLIINMDKSTTISAAVEFYDEQLQAYKKSYKREEYHLTPLNGDVQSQTVLLNNKQLTVGRSGDIPALEPNFVLATEPIQVEPYSIVFVRMPYVNIPACRWKHE